MLQQTQVSRVIQKFEEFVDRFPSVQSLAASDEGDVLAIWSGLGYYRRARHLHAAAREIVNRFGGRVPQAADELLTLPGVGRYTAGAISSMAFGISEPIVDGNVARVLVRIEGRDLAADEAVPWAWTRAATLVQAIHASNRRPGRRSRPDPGNGPNAVESGRQRPTVAAFNEGLMELGALICTPRAPKCMFCPVRAECRAFAAGTQERIPRPKRPAPREPMFCAAVVIEDSSGRLLIERRADDGMWAGMWQTPTLESRVRPSKGAVEQWIGAPLDRIERFSHGATHRDLEFQVWRARAPVVRAGAVWRTRAQIGALGLSNPMRRILLGSPRTRG